MLADPGSAGGLGLAALAQAYLPVYFAYSGWNTAIFVGGEVRDPETNLPRALVGGTLGITALYLMVCFVFVAMFSASELAGSGEAGSAAAARLFGPGGRLGLTVLILVALLGSLNGTVMAGSRIAYAMAGQGHCFAVAGRLHARRGTPVAALWMQALWAGVLIVTQRFEALMAYTSAAMLVTGTATALAVMVLRRRMPETTRPYETWAYPLPPLLYAGSSVLALVVLAAGADPSVLFGAGWFALAWVAHALWSRRGVGSARP
jgi:APA family basic amino acid/polyamine antiporter